MDIRAPNASSGIRTGGAGALKMVVKEMGMRSLKAGTAGIALAAFALVSNGVSAQSSGPENLLPPEPAKVERAMPDYTQMQAQQPRPVAPAPASRPEAAQSKAAQPSVADSFGDVEMVSGEVVQEIPSLVGEWSLAEAQALAKFIDGIGAEGLMPKDYGREALAAAIAKGPGPALNAVASERFVWLVEDMRDGRTPMDGRKQWFAMDPDADRMPTHILLERALETGDIAGTLTALDPVHPDYALLKAELAKTPASNSAKRKLIMANMDRWRWLPQDLGKKYLMTNVPEYQLRLTVNDKIIKNYRTIVGKPGRTATPQLAEMVEGVIFNPTWTVPQSIVKGEGLGARVLGNPAWARRNGYTATRADNGFVTVVQQPGPTNSLGLMKLDMPNRHAIFLHDTPSRNLFAQDARALSHGCIRVQGARELAMTMAILGNMESKDDIPGIQQEVQDIAASGEYTSYPITNQWPVYITYFTMARDVDGKMATFKDIYDRDGAVLASFDAPRKANRSRVQDEEIIPLEAPGA